MKKDNQSTKNGGNIGKTPRNNFDNLSKQADIDRKTKNSDDDVIHSKHQRNRRGGGK